MDSKYNALPQNLLIVQSTLLENFETTTGFTVPNGSIANNVTEFKIGTQSIKCTTAVGATGQFYKNLGAAIDLSNLERVSLWVYIHDPVADYNFDEKQGSSACQDNNCFC